MQNTIPRAEQRLFWDMDAQRLDIDSHAQTIIERVLNNGTLADWRWLVATYGTSKIRAALESERPFKRDNIRQQSRRLAGILLR